MDPDNKSGAMQALVVAIYEVGCLIGSFLIVFVGDKLGRRKSVLIGTVIMLIGTTLQATAFTLGHLIVGRIVTGLGNGMNTSSIPVWQSEMAPPKIRGFLVLFEGALITGGIMVSSTTPRRHCVTSETYSRCAWPLSRARNTPKLTYR